MQTSRKLIAAIILLVSLAVCRGGNYVPNASFECGTGRGWVPFSTGPNDSWGNLQFISGLLTNTSFHGAHSLRLPQFARLHSRAIWLTNGTYTLSFYGRGTASMQFGIFREPDLKAAANPPNTASLTTTWTRFTAPPFSTTSNAFYYVRLGYGLADAEVDAVQLEPGSSATAFVEQAPIECAISIPNTNNMWFAGDSPAFTLNFWNSGSLTNIRVNYNVYDLGNSNVMPGSVVATVAAGTNSSQNISLSGVGKGWFRITSYLGIFNGSDDEATTAIYPYASNVVNSVSWLGGHPPMSPFHSRREHLARRNTARSLSPNSLAARWQLIQPHTNTDFVFFDVCYTNWAAEGLDIVCDLTPEDKTWNPWATNSDGSASMSFWSNYCYMVARRVSVTLGLTNVYYEIGPNEPYQSGPIGTTDFVSDSEQGFAYTGTNLPINARVWTNYAKLLTHGVAGVTQAFANAKIIGIAGAYGDSTWANGVWTNLSAGTKSAISVISMHHYPDDFAADPNIGYFQDYYTTRPGPWLAFTTTNNVEVWNTESGCWDTGPILGLNGLFPMAYEVHWTPPYEAQRSEWMLRHLTSTVRLLPEALRCIGYGMRKWFFYDTRPFNDSSYNLSQPYVADYLQVDRPVGVAISIASSLVARGFGSVTNTSLGAYLEMYAYTNYSGDAVISAWSADRANRVLTLTNSNFGLLDCMGNTIQSNALTARLTRVPRYFVSHVLTLAQLSNTLVRATSASAPDILAPNISIDVIPTGSWSGDTNYAFFKWSAIDDTYTAWQSMTSQTNVASRWKLDNGSWSDYSASNHVWIPNLSAGNHTFRINSRDVDGNVSEAVYTFVPNTSKLTVTHGLGAGTLHVGPP